MANHGKIFTNPPPTLWQQVRYWLMDWLGVPHYLLPAKVAHSLDDNARWSAKWAELDARMGVRKTPPLLDQVLREIGLPTSTTVKPSAEVKPVFSPAIWTPEAIAAKHKRMEAAEQMAPAAFAAGVKADREREAKLQQEARDCAAQQAKATEGQARETAVPPAVSEPADAADQHNEPPPAQRPAASAAVKTKRRRKPSAPKRSRRASDRQLPRPHTEPNEHEFWRLAVEHMERQYPERLERMLDDTDNLQKYLDGLTMQALRALHDLKKQDPKTPEKELKAKVLREIVAPPNPEYVASHAEELTPYAQHQLHDFLVWNGFYQCGFDEIQP